MPSRRRLGDDAAVAPDDRAHRQLELAPPVTSVVSPNVQIIAMPVPLSGSASVVGDDRHLDAEQRRADRRAEERLVALVVGVGDERDARGEQLGAGGVDEDGLAAVGVGGSAIRW